VSTTVAAPTAVALPTTTTATPSTTTAPAPTTVTIHPLFVRTGAGTADGDVGQEIVTMEPTADHSLRVDFSEDEVAGLGDQSRAASWNAVTVATLLTGAPLEGRYRFEVAAYELADTERELGLDDKFNALSSYWGGFLSARVLAYLRGFPTDGLGGVSARPSSS
jgi:hypothetical protein